MPATAAQSTHIPRQVRKQVQEAERLLQELNTKPGQNPDATPSSGEPAAAAGTPANGAEKNNTNAAPDATPGSEPPAAGGEKPSPSPPGGGEDFKHKYEVLQGKYNSEISELKLQIAGLQERNSVLEQLLAKFSQQPSAPEPGKKSNDTDPKAKGKTYVKPEDIEEYGRDMLDVVRRAAREEIEPELEALRAENAQLKQQLGRTTETVAENARERMLAQLAREVPDWENVNTSPTFLAWLEDVDVFSGLKRREALIRAYNANDAFRVIGIFKAFKREDSATDPASRAPGRTPQVSKETLVAPGKPQSGAGTEAPGSNKRMWSQQEIADFYDRKRRGKIPATEAETTEREIAAAIREGRVTL